MLPSDLNHIAIIMDGNGRWASKRKKPRVFGHKKGSETVKKIIKICSNLGLKYLSLFAFSTENWNRPKEEVDALMTLFKSFLIDSKSVVDKYDICFKVSGEIEKLPTDIQKLVFDLVEKTESSSGMVLNLAISYGGRQDVLQALKLLCKDVLEGKIKINDLQLNMIDEKLWTAGLPDPDLLIRTSNEYRISNFMLWQLAYTEFYFSKTLWPDFDKDELMLAIESFSKRKRRFGGL